MARVAPEVPTDSDLLCEDCGYILNGLSDQSRCPECGKPVSESAADNPRRPIDSGNPIARFFAISAAVLFHPTRFYRTLVTRSSLGHARLFAWFYYLVTIGLTQLAVGKHLSLMEQTSQLAAWSMWFYGNFQSDTRWQIILTYAIVVAFLPLLLFGIMEGVTRLAAWLTAWEAAYRGLRMPYPAVLRAIYFHAIHYLPAILVIFATIYGYQAALKNDWIGPYTLEYYLYVLCGEVILAAVYLFWTYWIAMRNIMYANR